MLTVGGVWSSGPRIPTETICLGTGGTISETGRRLGGGSVYTSTGGWSTPIAFGSASVVATVWWSELEPGSINNDMDDCERWRGENISPLEDWVGLSMRLFFDGLSFDMMMIIKRKRVWSGCASHCLPPWSIPPIDSNLFYHCFLSSTHRSAPWWANWKLISTWNGKREYFRDRKRPVHTGKLSIRLRYYGEIWYIVFLLFYMDLLTLLLPQVCGLHADKRHWKVRWGDVYPKGRDGIHSIFLPIISTATCWRSPTLNPRK